MNEINKTVEEKYDGIKIVDYLKRGLSLSVSLVKKVKFGGVFINGENVHMRAAVHTGDRVCVKLPDETSEGIRPIQMPLEIVYEDEYLIAINKPSEMPTHPSKGNSLPTLAEAVMGYFYPNNFVFRAVNRLDRDTSGIVIIAKDAVVADRLSKEMKSGGFLKQYTALISGTPEKKSGIIDAPIERESEGNMKRIVRADGKRAITEYVVTEELENGDSIVKITLHTGRTHQIRVHMAHIGHPLKYDFLYGEREVGKIYKLHAHSIEFTHPITNERICLSVPPKWCAK